MKIMLNLKIWSSFCLDTLMSVCYCCYCLFGIIWTCSVEHSGRKWIKTRKLLTFIKTTLQVLSANNGYHHIQSGEFSSIKALSVQRRHFYLSSVNFRSRSPIPVDMPTRHLQVELGRRYLANERQFTISIPAIAGHERHSLILRRWKLWNSFEQTCIWQERFIVQRYLQKIRDELLKRSTAERITVIRGGSCH